MEQAADQGKGLAFLVAANHASVPAAPREKRVISSAAMTGDLWALVATIGLAMAQLAMASILTLRQFGGRWVAGPRDAPKAASGIAGRIVRAHRNLLEIFPQFVAAVFVVHTAGVAGHRASIGAWVFFAARCLYVPAYAFGPTGARPACWIAAQLGILLILADLIR